MKTIPLHTTSLLKKQVLTLFIIFAMAIIFQTRTYALNFDDLRPTPLWHNLEFRLTHTYGDRPSLYTLLTQEAFASQSSSHLNSIWLAATGDLMFHSPQVAAAYQATDDTYDFKDTFRAVKPYLSAADYTFGNFETTTAGSERGYSGYPAFNAPDATLDALKWAGYDFLSTANNHCLDRGISGLERTISQIRARDIEQSGTFMQSEKDAPRYKLLSINHINLAVVSLTYGCNGIENSLAPDTLHQAVNLIDEAWLQETLTTLEASDVDETIVFIHWGNEYQRQPSTYQKDLADNLFAWGADIILGSHPHVIQHSEIVDVDGESKYIIYSMGNFVSNQSRHTLSTSNRKYTENGVIPFIQLTKSADGTAITAVKHVPTWVHKFKDASGTHYEILPIESEDMYRDVEDISALTQDAYRETMTMMQNYAPLQ